MSEPWTEPPTTAGTPAGFPEPPKSLLEQMQELLASINSDLAGLDSDLRSSAARTGDRSEPGGQISRA